MNQLPLSLPTALAAREALFRAADGHPLTTSRAVAQRFGKQHAHVIRSIEKLRADLRDPDFWRSNFGSPNLPGPEFWRLNFELRTYRDPRGKTQPEYTLTRKGFELLAMGFAGREALMWKVAFLDAFDAIEAELLAFYQRWMPVAQGKQAGQRRQAIGAPLGKTPAAITYHTGQLRRFGLLPTLPARGAAGVPGAGTLAH